MNTFGGIEKQGLVLGGRLLGDGVSSGVEPEEPVESAVCVEGEVNVLFDSVQGQGQGQVGGSRLLRSVSRAR